MTMTTRMPRRHAWVPPLERGWKVAYFGDSISDKWNLAGGITQGNYRDQIDVLFGLTRIAEGGGAGDWARGALSGRMISAATGQSVAGETNFVQACLAKLPDVVFVELGTNDWFFATDAYTPTIYGTAIDTMMAGLTANVPVRSVQALWPTAVTSGGTYKLLYSTSTTGFIADNATIATINTALQAATPAPIPFTASSQANDPPLRNGAPVILTANTAGANAQVVLGSNTVTGGPIQMDATGLGGTPAVKVIVWIGHASHANATSMNLPANAFPAWASSCGDAWAQQDVVYQRKLKEWNGKVNRIPVVGADLRTIPQSLLVDTTHPTDPGGTNFYVDMIRKALLMSD